MTLALQNNSKLLEKFILRSCSYSFKNSTNDRSFYLLTNIPIVPSNRHGCVEPFNNTKSIIRLQTRSYTFSACRLNLNKNTNSNKPEGNLANISHILNENNNTNIKINSSNSNNLNPNSSNSTNISASAQNVNNSKSSITTNAKQDPDSKTALNSSQNNKVQRRIKNPFSVAPKKPLGFRLLSHIKAIPSHLKHTPQYMLMIGSKLLSVSKLLLWSIMHPIAAKDSVKKVVNTHLIVPLKLMRLDVKLARKIFKTRKLEKRSHFTELEKRRLSAIASDFLRFVPYVVFIILPAFEIFLPIYLWAFPGAKPGWFESRKEKDKKLRTRLDYKLEMAKFLKATVEIYDIKKDNKAETSLSRYKSLAKKLSTSKTLEIEQLLQYAPLFNTHLRLEKLDLDSLKSMCHLLSIATPPGIASSDYWLRYFLIRKMEKLRKEDEYYLNRGTKNLSDQELIQANMDRAGRVAGVTREKLIANLDLWIQMNYLYELPIALILYTKAIYILPTPNQVIETENVKKTKELERVETIKIPATEKLKEDLQPKDLKHAEILNDLSFTIMRKVSMQRKPMADLYEALEEINDMTLVRDTTDDLNEFNNFLSDQYLDNKKQWRTGKLHSKLASLTAQIEDHSNLIKENKDCDESEVANPDGTDNDGFVTEEDFLRLIDKILPVKTRTEFFDPSLQRQLVRALNPENNKYGVHIVKSRRVIRHLLLPDKNTKNVESKDDDIVCTLYDVAHNMVENTF